MTQKLELMRQPDCIAVALVDRAMSQQTNKNATQYIGHYIVVSGIRGDSLLQITKVYYVT